MMLKKITFLLISIFIFSHTNAQVTIGSLLTPKSGAILDLKEDDEEGANSTRGLLMPRVALEDEKELAPAVKGTLTDTEKKAHTGLILYNVHLDTDKNLCPGLYAWDGSMWSRLYGDCHSGFTIEAQSVKPLYLLQGETHTIRMKSEGKWTLQLEGDTEIFVPGTITPTQGNGGSNFIDVSFQLAAITTTVTTKPTPTLTGVLVFVSEVDGRKKKVNIVGEKIYWNPPTNNSGRELAQNTDRATTRGIPQTFNFDVDGYFGADPQLNLLDFTNSTLPFTVKNGTLEPWVKLNNSTLDIDICNEEGTNRRQSAATVSNGVLDLDLTLAQEQLSLQIDKTGPINYTASAALASSLGVKYNPSSRREVQVEVVPIADWLIIQNPANKDPKIGVKENTTSLARSTKLNISLLGHVANKTSVATKTIARDIVVNQEAGKTETPFEVLNLKSSYVMDGLESNFTLKASSSWTATVTSNGGAIDVATISPMSGTGDATIKFKTAINSTAAQDLTTKIQFKNASGSQVKEVAIVGTKMTITVPGDILADADGYINGSATMVFNATSNSTRTLSITYPAIANASNNTINVSPTTSRYNSTAQYIKVTNGVMTKEVKISQSGLTFLTAGNVTINSDGDYKSLGLNLTGTRRSSNVSLSDNSWMRVLNPTTKYPSVGATKNTGAARTGRATITLDGYVAGKGSVATTSEFVNVTQEKSAIPTPDNVTYWMHYGFGQIYSEHNNNGLFTPNFQLRSIVFVIQVTINGKLTIAKYKRHMPQNPAIIKNIGIKEGTNLPMFDINGNCEVIYEDDYGTEYKVLVYPR